MNEVNAHIPLAFIQSRTRLSWRDVKLGLERQLISASVAIDHATSQLVGSTQPRPEEVELAGSSLSDPIIDLVSQLSSQEAPEPQEHNEAKWLYLMLAWTYQNRNSLSDPLGVVEAVYSDFGYPSEIAHFVRYMPMVGENLGSREMNEARLIVYWERYLERAAERFAPVLKTNDN